MSDARDDILYAIKAARTEAPVVETGAETGAEIDSETNGEAYSKARGRLGDHKANLIPARGRLGVKARVDLFIREAEQVNATVARVSSLSGVPRGSGPVSCQEQPADDPENRRGRFRARH